MPFGELVVQTAFDRSAHAYNGVARGYIIVIVAVGTPVMVERERTVDEGGEIVLAVFQASEDTFLYDRTCVVAVGDVANS